jgi:hypothetical protein
VPATAPPVLTARALLLDMDVDDLTLLRVTQGPDGTIELRIARTP